MKALLAGAMVCAVAVGVRAQTVCNAPDDLCTGDPCVIGDVDVTSPCTLDFGPRALVVAGRVGVPQNGLLAFTAGTITIEREGQVDADHRESGDNLADVNLTAAGAITVTGALGASGYHDSGTITVDAGGTLVVDGRVIADSSKNAGGTTGTLILRGAAGVTLAGKVEATGARGGSIEVSSSGGDVAVDRKLRVTGAKDQGGTVTVHAGGAVTVDADISVSAFEAGDIVVTSDAGDVTINRRLRARGAYAGTVMVASGGDLIVIGDVTVRGSPAGGEGMELTAAGHILVAPSSVLDARGGIDTIRIEASSATVQGKLRTDGETHPYGGYIRIKTLGGDLALTGAFSAKPGTSKDPGRHGGVIEASAANDLTATGSFLAAPGGCIAFFAGGMLDSASGRIDPPLSPDCPGSPSGAFLG